MRTVSLYAGLLALLYVALSVRTILLRRSLKIAIGDSGNSTMLRAMRVHSNFAEYAPFALLLIFLVEFNGAPPSKVHLLGGLLVLGRILHSYGVSQPKEALVFRMTGMVLTFSTILSCSIWLLRSYFMHRAA